MTTHTNSLTSHVVDVLLTDELTLSHLESQWLRYHLLIAKSFDTISIYSSIHSPRLETMDCRGERTGLDLSLEACDVLSCVRHSMAYSPNSHTPITQHVTPSSFPKDQVATCNAITTTLLATLEANAVKSYQIA